MPLKKVPWMEKIKQDCHLEINHRMKQVKVKKREKIPRKVGESFMETSRGLETSQKCPHEFVLGAWFPVNAFFGRV